MPLFLERHWSVISEGAVLIEIVDKDVKQIWNDLSETNLCVDFKSVLISQRAPPIILLWATEKWQYPAFPKASGIT